MTVEIKYANELPNAPEYQAVGVAAFGDFVILSFLDAKKKPACWVAVDPTIARELGESIARSGFAVQQQEDVYGKNPIMVEQMRQRLIVSIEHLLKSEIINENLDDPHMTAQKCVEIMLTEAM